MTEPPPVGLYIEGDRQRMHEAMAYLMTEKCAFRYSPRRQQIQVLLRSERKIRRIERHMAILHIYCTRRSYL